ncbi:MAG TPA: DUF2098 family protein [Candidatus Methanomethylophilaceae archaeon]|nr:DUF2098 family protein [Candidatus Methanomethylophilaceae archaeon]
MKVGDIAKYLPTSTVGKITEIEEKDGKVWIRLDYTGLFYDKKFLTSASESEYKPITYKERERKFEGRMQSIEDIAEAARDVDISDYTPSGGG